MKNQRFLKKNKLKYRIGLRCDKYVWDIIPFIQLDVTGKPAAFMIGWLCLAIVIPLGKTY